MAIDSTSVLMPGQRVTVQVAGALPSYLYDAAFKETLGNLLRTQGLNVERIDIASQYGLVSRDYMATITLTTLTQSKIYGVIGQVTSAAEGAGSYSPTVTVPEVGMVPQSAPARDALSSTFESLGATAEDIFGAIGTAAKQVADAPGQFFTVTKMVVIGIVVIAGLVAFGPNLRGVLKR